MSSKMQSYKIIKSDYPDIAIPDENIWNYMYPRLVKWRNLDLYVDGNTGEKITYDQCLAMSLRWAKEMLKYTYETNKKQTALILLPNCPELFPIFLGSFASGVIICPTRHDSTADFLFSVIQSVKPSIILTDPETSLKTVRKVLKDLDSTYQPLIMVKDSSVDDLTSINRILTAGDELELHKAGQYDSQKHVVILFSSGTTGVPKGICLNSKYFIHNSIICSQAGMNPYVISDSKKQQVTLVNAPWSHMFSIVHMTLIAPQFGHKIVNVNCVDEEVQLYNSILKHKPDVLISRPNTVENLGRINCAEGLKSIRSIIVAGCQPNPEFLKELKNQADDQLFIQNCYGTTEVGITSCTPMIQKANFAMSGKLCPNLRVRIVNVQTGDDIGEPFQEGEIIIHSPWSMSGYHENIEATEEAFTSDNWFRTGDIGFFDTENYIKVVDRMKDVLTVGDVKVFPTNIENMIMEHPAVKEVGIIGVPDGLGGELPKAFIVRAQPVTEQEIIDLVAQKAPNSIKLNGGIQFVNKLPRNNMGKLLRKLLREVNWFDQN